MGSDPPTAPYNFFNALESFVAPLSILGFKGAIVIEIDEEDWEKVAWPNAPDSFYSFTVKKLELLVKVVKRRKEKRL